MFSGKEDETQAEKGNGVWALLSLLLVTLLALFIAGPFGNFPTNDDRIYAYGVKSIAETGVFSIWGSNAFDFIPITFGALVCKVVGFSFDSLRWITIGFHLFGITGLYLSLRELRIKPADAALLSAVYALNPFMINLALSFMTDVPALALANWTLFATIAAIYRKRFSFWLLSILFLTASMSVRQSSLVLLPPILLAGLITLKNNRDRFLFLTIFLIPLISYFCLEKWLLEASLLTVGYTEFSRLLQNSLLPLVSWPPKITIVNLIAQGLCYVGLALFPVTLILTICAARSGAVKRSALMSVLVSLLLVTAPLAYLQMQGAYMPYSLNLFMPPILGAYCLIGGVPTWRYEHLKIFSYFADLAATLAAFCLILCVLKPIKLSETIKKSDDQVAHMFFVVLIVCITGGLIVQLSACNYDRYYLIALAPLLVCLGPLWRDLEPLKLRILSATLILAVAAYGIIAALDVMNFSRAQWQAIKQLEKTGVSPRQIDGGPNYTLQVGGFRFGSTYKQGLGWPESMRGGKVTSKLRWWPVIKDDYIIAASRVDGYHAIAKLKYWSPVFWKHRIIYTLKSDKLP